MTGTSLQDAHVVMDQAGPDAGQPVIDFTTTSEGTRRLARMTGAHIGQRLALVVDGAVYTAPMIQSPITGGKGRISSDFTMEEAMELAAILRTGTLPCPVRVVSAGPIESVLH
jgi:preprotein translocase subunit SecD